MKKNAQNVLRISSLEAKLAKEQRMNERMLEQLDQQSKILDKLLTFHDKVAASQMNEALEDNYILFGEALRWKQKYKADLPTYKADLQLPRTEGTPPGHAPAGEMAKHTPARP